MSYTNVLNSVYAQATAVAGFSSANVSRQSFDILRRGQGSACVIAYDSFEQAITELGGGHQITWRFLLGLYTRATGQDAVSVSANMATVRQDFITRFNQYPNLGGTANVFLSLVQSGEEAADTLDIGGVSYSYEVLRLFAIEDVAADYQE